MIIPTIHHWTARAGWSGADEMAAADAFIGIDPGNTGAFVVLLRTRPTAPDWWASWTMPSELRQAVMTLGERYLDDRLRFVVIVEEPFFASSRSGAIEQGWAAGHVATLVAVATGATDIIRAKSEAWQSAMLGPVLTEEGFPLAHRKRGEPKQPRVKGTEDKRSIRKRQALALLPVEMVHSVTTKARREALADARGIASWGMLFEDAR